VRVAGVDCPEKGQPFGAKAKQFAADLVFGRSAQIKVYGRDRYGRTLGDAILADGRALSRELVKAGYAWWYRAFSKDKKLEALEAEARLAKRGLWADPHPVAPWDWRRPTFDKRVLRAGSDVPGEPPPPGSPALSKSSGDEIVYATDSGTKYHRAGCRALKSALPVRLKDAVRKYEPCRLCKPPTMRIGAKRIAATSERR